MAVVFVKGLAFVKVEESKWRLVVNLGVLLPLSCFVRTWFVGWNDEDIVNTVTSASSVTRRRQLISCSIWYWCGTVEGRNMHSMKAEHSVTVEWGWNSCCIVGRYWVQILALRPAILTTCSRDILENLTGPQPVKKFSAFYGTRRFITAFTVARQLSVSWVKTSSSCSSSHFVKVHFNIIFCYINISFGPYPLSKEAIDLS